MIRLTSLLLDNFKNVRHGTVKLSLWKKGEPMPSADIIGIYGQNGSGKTSVVQALRILKAVLTEDKISDFAQDCISKDSAESRLTFEGIVFQDDSQEAQGMFRYQLTLCEALGENGVAAAVISGENLAFKRFGSEGSVMQTLLSYGGTQRSGFRPKVMWHDLLALSDDVKTDMAVARRLSEAKETSLIFSDDFFTVLNEIIQSSDESSRKTMQQYRQTIDLLRSLVKSLMWFGLFDLAVVMASRYADSMDNYMRISTHEGKYGKLANASFDVDLTEPAVVTSDQLALLNNTVGKMNPVLSSLVPGLSLSVVDLGNMLDDKGQVVERIEMTCTRGSITVPLRCESEGIKKLVSILTLLIDVYAKPSACVAIDELDSGVFEFLLGELLQVLQEHGAGQLIFTAHNLRPLEVLNHGSLIITTTNPDRRYIKFHGSRAGNNLRSQYLRAVNLGGQPETVYEPTSKFDIDSAFYDVSFPEPEEG